MSLLDVSRPQLGPGGGAAPAGAADDG